MFFSTEISGRDLPNKTVCLTFDDGPGVTGGDGPGPRTLEIARFLRDRAIPGAFFTIGRFAAATKAIVEEVAQMGHLIGNHTYNHPTLAGQSGKAAGHDVALMAVDNAGGPQS